MNTDVFPEPGIWIIAGQNFAVWAVPFFAYFLGIGIRKRVFPGKGSPPLVDQMLLGIPVCLIVVSPLISALQQSFGTHIPTYLFTVGIIMEHGMLVHETASKRVKEQIAEVRRRGSGS